MDNNKLRNIAFIKASKNRKLILLALYKSKIPLTPSEIAEKTEVPISSISRSLKELKNNEFIDFLKEGRIKLCFLTDKSKDLMKIVS